MSMHIHKNVFSDVWFGANDRGILGATPTDPMHAFLSGILPYTIKAFLDPLSSSELAVIDDIVDAVLHPIRSSLRADYPWWNFSRWITNLTFLTADEWGLSGVLFDACHAYQEGDGHNYAILPKKTSRKVQDGSPKGG